MFGDDLSAQPLEGISSDRSVDPNQVVPLYHQIYLILREQILEGKYTSQPLPGELILAEQFNVSRVTMRRALQDLVKEGLIARGRGKGTFVKPRRDVRPVADRNITSLMADSQRAPGDALVDVLEVVRISPPPDVIDALMLTSRDFVQKIIRVQTVAQQPQAHLTTYIPELLGQTFGRRDLQAKSIDTLLEESGIARGQARQSISARLADASIASALQVPVGAPLVSVTKITFDTNGRPVHLMRGLYRPDKFTLRMELDAQGNDGQSVWTYRETETGFKRPL